MRLARGRPLTVLSGGMIQQELQGKQTENLPADHLKRKQWRKKKARAPVQGHANWFLLEQAYSVSD